MSTTFLHCERTPSEETNGVAFAAYSISGLSTICFANETNYAKSTECALTAKSRRGRAEDPSAVRPISRMRAGDVAIPRRGPYLYGVEQGN